LDEARADISEAERVALSYFDDRYFVVCRCHPRVVQIHFEQGKFRDALELALQMLRGEFGWVPEVALQALSCAVNMQLLLGDVEAAAASTKELLGRMRPTMSSSYPACEYAASIAAMHGNWRLAARLIGFVDAIDARIHFLRINMRQMTYDALRARLERELDEQTLGAECSAGARWSPDTAIAQAYAALQSDSGSSIAR
jgi:hypothetical protein